MTFAQYFVLLCSPDILEGNYRNNISWKIGINIVFGMIFPSLTYGCTAQYRYTISVFRIAMLSGQVRIRPLEKLRH